MSVASSCSVCFCAVLCVGFCTVHFVMAPLNLTCLHCLQHSFFEHYFNLYYITIYRGNSSFTKNIGGKRKVLRKHSLHGENSSLGFSEAVHQWKQKWKLQNFNKTNQLLFSLPDDLLCDLVNMVTVRLKPATHRTHVE